MRIDELSREERPIDIGHLDPYLRYSCSLFAKQVSAIEAAFNSMASSNEIRPLRKTPFAELESISESFNALIGSQRAIR